jgi:flagellar basal-body rod protein FlgB
MSLFPKVVGTLEQSMQAANLRHQVIANNIANANVPGFQASEVTFEEHLKAALDGNEPVEEPGLQGLVTEPGHIPIGTTVRHSGLLPQITTSTMTMRQDGNNLDVEAEMAKLAANQLWYQSLVRSVSDEFNRLRVAIMEGRR